MNAALEGLVWAGRPLSSLFYALSLLVLVPVVFRGVRSGRARFGLLAAFTGLFWAAYAALLRWGAAAQWLYPLESPLLLVTVLLVLPAIFLPRGRGYRWFLVLPALVLLGALADGALRVAALPAGAGFAGFLIRPGWLMAGAAAFLVLAQSVLGLDTFRRVVRWTMFLILMYGGFAFRQNYADYRHMLARRQTATRDVLLLAETTPVLQDDRRLSYVPSAPCRFSADGGYVQGCVLELLQRLMQINFGKVRAGDVGETALLSMALSALLMLAGLGFIGARWWCGWACPLSALGDGLNWVRRRLGLPHWKPVPAVKLGYLLSGLSFGSLGLLLARAVPALDAQGQFLGCKIPLYPFCKLCPGQQVCPVASRGPAAYPPLPGAEWLFGFFRLAAPLLLAVYLLSYLCARRLWCRFCPMGMLGGLFNRGGLLALKKDVRKCTGCGVCREVCPMDIPSVAAEKARADVACFDCVYCLKCVTHCPQDGCLRAEFAGQPVAESRFPKP